MNVFDVLREKLEEGANVGIAHHFTFENDVAIKTVDAIEIVNQVEQEYSNDFCEWTEHETEIDVYFTKCGQAHIFVDGTPEENNHEFCPYCGKKIKVVE